MRQKFFVFSTILLFVWSVCTQIQLFQEWDMLYLLEGGKRLLAGGTYVNDMFESNPPLIYYFSIFINILSQTFSVSSIFVFKFIVYIFIIYSLCISHYLLNFNSKNSMVDELLLFTLAFCLLILSLCCFGEREHLMLILTMPYYFLLYQVASGIKFKPVLRIIISFFAALGFAIKPYFLFSLVFSELLFMLWQRDWKTVFRLEAQVILWTFCLYLVSIAVLMPDFYAIILPWVFKYYVFSNESIFHLLVHLAIINALFLLLCTLYLSQETGRLESLMLVLIFGCVCSFMIQGKGWYYHAFPLITINSLLSVLLAYRLIQKNNKNRIDKLLILAIIIAQFSFTIIPFTRDYYKKNYYYKNALSSFQQFTKIARKYGHDQYIFFFATDLSRVMPIVYYSDAKLGSRFPALWMLPGILNRQHGLHQCDKTCFDAQRQLVHYITEDFKRYQPQLVFVDVNPQKYLIINPFDYFELMKTFPEFISIWQHYCYLLTVNNYAIYQRCQN